MKAYMVHPGKDPFDEGCVLVYAPCRHDARMLTFRYGPWMDYGYIEFRAIRKPEYDKFYKPGKTGRNGCPVIETNDELPKGAPPFFTDYHIGY